MENASAIKAKPSLMGSAPSVLWNWWTVSANPVLFSGVLFVKTDKHAVNVAIPANGQQS